jgi:pantetheine-phosphate adenylyltransferase
MATGKPSIAIYPGTFDPITNGHLDLIRRGQGLFDQLIVAIGHNPEKTALFTLAERKKMIDQLLAEQRLDVRVDTFTGLTMDYAQLVGATVMLRGIRNASDLQFEFQLALTNRAVADIETVFIIAGDEHAFTSSSLIKQIAAGGKIDRLAKLLPSLVIDQLKAKLVNNACLRADLSNDAAHK